MILGSPNKTISSVLISSINPVKHRDNSLCKCCINSITTRNGIVVSVVCLLIGDVDL